VYGHYMCVVCMCMLYVCGVCGMCGVCVCVACRNAKSGIERRAAGPGSPLHTPN